MRWPRTLGAACCDVHRTTPPCRRSMARCWPHPPRATAATCSAGSRSRWMAASPPRAALRTGSAGRRTSSTRIGFARLFDAVVIGAGTVRADDPQLTTREVEGPSPVRVVLDTNRRLDARLSRVPRGTGDPAAVRRRRLRTMIASATHRCCGCRVRAKDWISSLCSRRLPNADCGACSSRAAASPCRASLPPARSIGCTSRSRRC